MMHATLFGLGEAGALYSEGLVAQGWTVTGYDPADTPTPAGVTRATTVEEALRDADVVFSLVGGKAAQPVASAVAEHLGEALFIDMNSASPQIKRSVAEAAGTQSFADVAVVGSVPAGRSATAVVISGPASGRAAEIFRQLGAPVEDIAGEAGDAATRKLLRSSFMKGLGALIVEAMAAGEAADAKEWVLGQISGELQGGQTAALRLHDGTIKHAARRSSEASQTAQMLDVMGVRSTMSRAAAEVHLALADSQQASRKEIVEAFEGVPVANIGDSRERMGMVDGGIRAIWRGARAVGFARTVWVTAGDNKAIHEAIAQIQPGDFLVVNGQGCTTRALIGELMAQRAQKKGCAGIVIDGAMRDAADLEEVGFPAWARAVCPAGPYKNGPGKVNVPVAVGGVAVQPGDLIVGDDDGVIVIPFAEALASAKGGKAVLADEAGRREVIHQMQQVTL